MMEPDEGFEPSPIDVLLCTITPIRLVVFKELKENPFG